MKPCHMYDYKMLFLEHILQSIHQIINDKLCADKIQTFDYFFF